MIQKAEHSRDYTVRDVAALEGVKQDVVLTWIHAKELEARDVRAHGTKRPRWRITAESLKRFRASRTNIKPERRPRYRPIHQPVEEFV